MTTEDGFLAKPYAPKMQQAIDNEMDKIDRDPSNNMTALLEEFADILSTEQQT